MESILFYIFGGIAVLMIILMIFQANPIASAFYLIVAFFGLAGLYVLLSAPFVAVLQILVYAGAIMVLFVFVIMLLRLKKEDLVEDKVTLKKGIICLLGILFAGFIAYYFLKMSAFPFQELAADFGNPKGVGRLLFTRYLIPFELTSVLLLVAIVGVIVLGRKGSE